MRIFEESGCRIEGNVLSKTDFQLFLGKANTKLDPERLTEFVKRAEEYLDKPLLVLPLSRYRDFAVNGTREGYEKFYTDRRARLVTLGYAEMYEKRGRFLEGLMDTVWATLEETTWLVPAHNKNNPVMNDGIPSTWGGREHGVAIFAASTGAYLAFIYSQLKDEMDAFAPEVGKRIVYEVHERCIRPFLERTYFWTGEKGNRPNNWNPWITMEVVLATALLSDDDAEREAVLSRAFMLSDNFVSGYGIDGGCDEGPSYWCSAGLAYITFLSIARDLTGGKINMLTNPFIKKIAEYVAKVHIAGRYFVNSADCVLCPNVTSEALLFAGESVDSQTLLQMGQAVDASNPFLYTGSIRNPYRTYLALCRPLTKNAPAIHSPLDVWFRDLKIALMRESENAEMGFCVALKGGHNAESHNHNDIGQLYLYKDGKPVIVDMGAMTYTKKTFGPERYTIMAMRSLYHSTVTPSGVEQLPGKNSASSDEYFDEQSRSAWMQLKTAYPPEAGLVDLTRRVTLSDGVVTVSDTVVFEKESEVDIHFLTYEAPSENTDGSLSLVGGVTLRYPNTLSYRLEEIPIGDDKKLKGTWGRDFLYMMHFTKTAKEGSYRFEFIR